MKRNRLIILGLIIIVLIMSVGYATLSTQVSLTGSTSITSEWNVGITNVTVEFVSENCKAGEPQFTNTTVAFNAELCKPGDHITYAVTVKNSGTIDGKLDTFSFTPDSNGSPAIQYVTSDLKDTLAPGEEACFFIKVSFDENATEMPEIKTKTITGVVEYVQQ